MAAIIQTYYADRMAILLSMRVGHLLENSMKLNIDSSNNISINYTLQTILTILWADQVMRYCQFMIFYLTFPILRKENDKNRSGAHRHGRI